MGLVGVVVGAVACVPVLVLSAWPGLWETALPWLIGVGVVGGGPLAAGAVTAWWLFGRPAWRDGVVSARWGGERAMDGG